MYLSKFIDKVKEFFYAPKYKISIDPGVFDVVIYGQSDEKGIPEGKWVVVERSTELEKNYSNPNIKIIDADKKDVNVTMTKTGREWKFIMPPSDVIIIPTVKRKIKET